MPERMTQGTLDKMTEGMIMEYLGFLIAVLLISVILEKFCTRKIFHSFKQRIKILGTIFILSVILDSFAIWRGYSFFNQERVIGITIGFMPLEEYLFAFIIPYFVIVMYETLKLIIAEHQ